jgi:hypothetical protein
LSISAFDPNRTFGASASALHIDEVLSPPRVMRGLTQPFCRSAPAGNRATELLDAHFNGKISPA